MALRNTNLTRNQIFYCYHYAHINNGNINLIEYNWINNWKKIEFNGKKGVLLEVYEVLKSEMEWNRNIN